MRRVSILACLLLLGVSAHGQAVGTLRVTIALTDAEQNATPVARHVLLISANPPDAPPRAVTTGRDGTIAVRLRPGSYIVESEKPVAFQGRTYEWAQRVTVSSGGETVLQLTSTNAAVETPAPGSGTDASFIFPRWQASVLPLWTPTAHASGFLVDADGLIATNQRVVGTATAVEVEVSPQVKVMARVLAADPARDVAVLWIDASVAASLKPVPMACAPAAAAAVAVNDELFTIGTPQRGDKSFLSAPAGRVDRRAIVADWRLPSGSSGGPVFNKAGELVGITSISPDDEIRTWASRVVRLEEACAVIASARAKRGDGPAPSATRLPLEPTRPFTTAALEQAARGRAGSLSPPAVTSADFTIAFITPVLTFAAQRAPGSGSSADVLRAIRDFANWSDYVNEFPPVLLVRVTPKQVEGFWAKVGRAAAMTQGVALPAIKRAAGSFSRLRVFCGDAEIALIHPFLLEQRVSESEVLYEGLYVLPHDALGPHCATATMTLFSAAAPEKGDTRPIDDAVLERVWQDFGPYRAAPR